MSDFISRFIFDYACPLAVIAIVAAIAGNVLVAHRRQRSRDRYEDRFQRGQCLACGYDLRGASGRCPECGHPIDPREYSSRS